MTGSRRRTCVKTTFICSWLLFIMNARWTASASLSVVQSAGSERICRQVVPVVYDRKAAPNAAERTSTIFIKAEDLKNLQLGRRSNKTGFSGLGRSNKTECQQGDPLPQPNQVDWVIASRGSVPGACTWKWQCYKDPARLLTTWQEAVLVSKKCGSADSAGSCRLNYMDALVLRKADCKTQHGQEVWRATLEPQAISASCHLNHTHQNNASPNEYSSD